MKKQNYWKNRTVFVTGVTGFVGSNLAARLVKEGAQVIGLVRDDVSGSNYEKSGLSRTITTVHGDLEDLHCIERVLNEYSVQDIYHLGAQTIVGTANRSPLSTFRSNILGTVNLLEAARGKSCIESIIVASSDKAYGTHKKLPYKETYPLLPQYPYDTSKACADLIAMSYFNTYSLPIVITRFANIYGPGDMNFSRIIPDALQHILKGEAPIIRSDGTPERDYLYVDDVVDLYLLLGQSISKIKGEVFNAGHNRPYSVNHVIKTLLKVAKQQDLKPVILGKGSLKGEIDRQWLDGSKVKKILGWSPRVNLESGLKKTLNWYRTHAS